MSKSDPFGFDMSVSNDKKKRTRGKRGMSGAFETSTRVCEHEGCEESGKYRAPKSPDSLEEYFWFCKDHVRAYNLKWNFFNGSEEELAAQIDKDRVWERETKPFGSKDEARAWSRLGIDDPHQVLGENATRNPGKSGGAGRRLPPTERRVGIRLLLLRRLALPIPQRQCHPRVTLPALTVAMNETPVQAVVGTGALPRCPLRVVTALGAVVTLALYVLATGGIGFACHQSAVGIERHTQCVGQLHPFESVDVHCQVPVADGLHIQPRQQREVANHHESLDMVGIPQVQGLPKR